MPCSYTHVMQNARGCAHVCGIANLRAWCEFVLLRSYVYCQRSCVRGHWCMQIDGASTSKAVGEDDSGAGCSKAAGDADEEGEEGDDEDGDDGEDDSDEVCCCNVHSIAFLVAAVCTQGSFRLCRAMHMERTCCEGLLVTC